MIPLIEVKNLAKQFPIESGLFKTKGVVDAVKGVSFSIQPGEIVALVGESGSGKTTVGKMIQGLIPSTDGEILFDGENASNFSREKRARFVQTIFQDPYASLNPKLSVGFMLKESLDQSKAKIENMDREIEELLISVGLPTNILHNYPHQFSGGQRQRLGIARALAMKPKLIAADEPVSALDLSVQAQILNLLMELKEKFSISYLLIAHDLSIVEHMADRVMVMHNGEIVEQGNVKEIFTAPKQSYTQTLLSAMPPIAG